MEVQPLFLYNTLILDLFLLEGLFKGDEVVYEYGI